MNKFLTSAILAAMISSANTEKLISKNFLNISGRNVWKNSIIYGEVSFKKGPNKINSVGKL